MYYPYYTIGGELYHHGIQGQKWGVRNGPPYPLDRDYKVVNKKQTMWRTGSFTSNFMNRKYTYVNVCEDAYDHYMQTEGLIETTNSVEALYEMKPKKDLKIAKLDKVADIVLGMNNKKRTNNVVLDLKKIDNSYIDGMFGENKKFNNLISVLEKQGYDGMEDPVDGTNELQEKKPIISTVIFNPNKNIKIVKASGS